MTAKLTDDQEFFDRVLSTLENAPHEQVVSAYMELCALAAMIAHPGDNCIDKKILFTFEVADRTLRKVEDEGYKVDAGLVLARLRRGGRALN